MDFLNLLLRSLQFLWALLILALIGNVIASNYYGKMSAINYALFADIIAWLALLFGLLGALISAFSDGLFSYVGLALDALATLFTFIAAIVLAAKLHSVNCGGNIEDRDYNWIGYGSYNDEKRCREIQASTAFMWFLFACLAASLALSFLKRRRGGSSTASTGPHMSQVTV